MYTNKTCNLLGSIPSNYREGLINMKIRKSKEEIMRLTIIIGLIIINIIIKSYIISIIRINKYDINI
jgi:hypothetical protein